MIPELAYKLGITDQKKNETMSKNDDDQVIYIKNFAQRYGQRAVPILCIYFQPIVVLLDTFFNSGQYVSLRWEADEEA
jgi:hypothetical protein